MFMIKPHPLIMILNRGTFLLLYYMFGLFIINILVRYSEIDSKILVKKQLTALVMTEWKRNPK